MVEPQPLNRKLMGVFGYTVFGGILYVSSTLAIVIISYRRSADPSAFEALQVLGLASWFGLSLFILGVLILFWKTKIWERAE